MQLVAARTNGKSPAPTAGRDDTAFAGVYRLHSAAIYNFVLRSVRDPEKAQDVCQEIWVIVHRQLPGLQNPDCLRSWLYRIATRACIDASRRNSRSSATMPLTDTEESSDNVEEAVTGRERSRLVWQALAALPPRQHMALFLKVVEGRSYREIREVMKTSEDGVADLVYRARRRLATAYRDLEPSSERRCRLARRAMAALVDGEATRVQVNALRAHAMECPGCRSELPAQQTASRRYAALALLPVPSALTRKVLSAAQAQSLTSGGLPAFKLIGAGLVKSNLIGLTATAAIVGGVALAGDQSVGPSGGTERVATIAPSLPEPSQFDLFGEQSNGHQPIITSSQHFSTAGLPIGPLPDLNEPVTGLVDTVDSLTKLGLTEDLAKVQAVVNGLTGDCSTGLPTVPDASAATGALTGGTQAATDSGGELLPEVEVIPPQAAIPSPVTVPPVVPVLP